MNYLLVVIICFQWDVKWRHCSCRKHFKSCIVKETKCKWCPLKGERHFKVEYKLLKQAAQGFMDPTSVQLVPAIEMNEKHSVSQRWKLPFQLRVNSYINAYS